ncbi:MAG: hypothetical protein CBARDMAM_4717 [uncultured Caballeronia sp.]|nr:MAG: hypothetical protein CBARDMAM_4717 [uncultured Caballeronia sp.]
MPSRLHDGCVHSIWHNYYDSPYNIIVIEALAKWIYPEQLKDLSVKATHDELISKIPGRSVKRHVLGRSPRACCGRPDCRISAFMLTFIPAYGYATTRDDSVPRYKRLTRRRIGGLVIVGIYCHRAAI